MKQEIFVTKMKQAISDVFETMLFQAVQFPDNSLRIADRMHQMRREDFLSGATLAFEGSCPGIFYFLIPEQAMGEMTSNFLGIDLNEITVEQKRDVVKEALNMIGGKTLSHLEGGRFKLGLPALMDEDNPIDALLENPDAVHLLIEAEGSDFIAGFKLG